MHARLRSGMAAADRQNIQGGMQHNFAKDVVLRAVDQISSVHPQIAAVLTPIRDVIVAVLPEHNAVGLAVDQLQQRHDRAAHAKEGLHDAERVIAERWEKGNGAVAIAASVVQLRMEVSGAALVSAGTSLVVTHGAKLATVAAGEIMALITPVLQWVQHNAIGLIAQGTTGMATLIQQTTQKLQAISADIKGVGQAVITSNGNLLELAKHLAADEQSLLDADTTKNDVIKDRHIADASLVVKDKHIADANLVVRDKHIADADLAAKSSSQTHPSADGKMEAVNDNLKRSNPGFNLMNIETSENCVHAAIAYDLRARGIPVEAKILPEDRINRNHIEIEQLYGKKFEWAGEYSKNVKNGADRIGCGSPEGRTIRVCR